MNRAILLLWCGLWTLGPADNALAQIPRGQQRRPAVREMHDPGQSQALTDEALRLYREGKLTQATEKVRLAIRLDERNDRALALSAEIALKQGRHELATAHVERSLAINGRNARAHFVYGQILLAQGRYLAGFDHMQKAAGLLPDGTQKDEARTVLGRLKEQHPEWFAPRTTSLPARTVEPPVRPAQPPPAGQAQSVGPGTDRPRVAVFTFENVGVVDTTHKWGETISEMLTTALINTNRFTVVERAQLGKVLQEQALGQSGAVESQTAVVVGQIMGLDAVVVGSLSQLASVYEADARILDVESGEAVAAANGTANSVDQLRAIASRLADQLAGSAAAIPTRAVPPDSAR